jgi:hypothetical protein
MKIKHLSITITLSSLLILAIGCKKAEAPPSAAEVDKQLKEENAAVSQGQGTATGTADGAATAQQSSADAQQVIDKANALLAQNKPDDALRLVQTVPFSSLTATQRMVMNNLQFQIRQSQANRGK